MLKVDKSQINGVVFAPTSKSAAHRALIMAFLSGGKVIGDMTSADIKATLEVLTALGGKFKKTVDGIECVGRNEIKSEIKINCHESGSTLRFILPLISAFGIEAEILGEGKLLKRPLKPLIDALNGAIVKIGNTINISGKLCGDEFSLDPSLSSQFVSGMMFALLALKKKTILKLTNEITSRPYVDLTIKIISEFGGVVAKEKGVFIIDGSHLKPTCYNVEGDYSGAAFMLTLGVLCGRVEVKNLGDSMQGDKIIVDIIKSMGGKIKETENGYCAIKSDLKAIDFNVENYPDLAPILSVLMANAKGVSRIYGASRLALKESDRYNAILDMLYKLGIKAKGEGGMIEIVGGTVQSATLNGFSDHRMVMSSVVALMNVGGNVTTENAVEKSYANFYNDLISLGGKIEIV